MARTGRLNLHNSVWLRIRNSDLAYISRPLTETVTDFLCLYDQTLSRCCAQYFGSILNLFLSLLSVGNQTPYFCDVSLQLFYLVLRFFVISGMPCLWLQTHLLCNRDYKATVSSDSIASCVSSGTCSKQNDVSEWSQTLLNVPRRSVLILAFSNTQGSPMLPSFHDSQLKNLYAFLTTLMRSTCPSFITILDLTNRKNIRCIVQSKFFGMRDREVW